MRTCQFKKAIKKLSRSTDVVWIDVCRILLFRHDNAERSISLLEERAANKLNELKMNKRNEHYVHIDSIFTFGAMLTRT